MAFPEEESDFEGFREWLLVRIGGPQSLGWEGIIGTKYGHRALVTKRFFELFSEFRIDVEKRGLKCVFKDHYDWEVESFGGPRSSEYFTRGWDKKIDIPQ